MDLDGTGKSPASQALGGLNGSRIHAAKMAMTEFYDVWPNKAKRCRVGTLCALPSAFRSGSRVPYLGAHSTVLGVSPALPPQRAPIRDQGRAQEQRGGMRRR